MARHINSAENRTKKVRNQKLQYCLKFKVAHLTGNQFTVRQETTNKKGLKSTSNERKPVVQNIIDFIKVSIVLIFK